MRKRRRSESDLQRSEFVNHVREAGALAYKADIRKGWPDWFVFWPNGRFDLVELKADDGGLSPMQVYIGGQLGTRGFRVIVLTGETEIRRYVRRRLREMDT